MIMAKSIEVTIGYMNGKYCIIPLKGERVRPEGANRDYFMYKILAEFDCLEDAEGKVNEFGKYVINDGKFGTTTKTFKFSH